MNCFVNKQFDKLVEYCFIRVLILKKLLNKIIVLNKTY